MQRITVGIFQPTVVRNGKRIKSKIWNCRWRDPITGKRCSETTGTKNKQAARQYANKLEEKLYRQATGQMNPAEEHVNMTWGEAKAKFLEFKSATLRPESIVAFKMSFTMFEQVAQPDLLRQVTRQVLSDFVIKRSKQKRPGQSEQKRISPVTINKDLRHLRSMLNWLRDQNYLAEAPSFRGLFLREERPSPVMVPTEDQVKIIEAVANTKLKQRSVEWWLTFIRIAQFTGARFGEILGLTWGDVDFKAQSVTIRRDTSKGRRDRTYEEAVGLVAVLKEWREVSGGKASDPVLPWGRDKRALYNDWHAILEQAGVAKNITPHKLRSTCASEMLAAGVALTTVRDWLGHSSVLVTSTFYCDTDAARRSVARERKVL